MRRCLLIFLMAWTAFALSSPHPSHAQDHADAGVIARSDHFVLTSDVFVDARTILSDLEAFRTAVLDDLGLTPQTDASEPLRLSIIDDPAVFAAISPGGITAAIYLQSAAGDDVVVGYSTEPDHLLSDALEPNWLRLVLRHEVVHHLLETHYPRKLPIWLGEGLAEYYSTYQANADGRVTFGRALPEQEDLSEAAAWLPMRTVIESMAKYPDFRAATSEPLFRAQRLYYGQSWALAHFVMDQPDGLASVHRFVDGWSPDADSEDSFERAFGLRYEPLTQRVREDIVRDGGNLRLRDKTDNAAAVIRLRTPDTGEQLANRLRLLLSHGRASDDTAAAIEDIQARLDSADPSGHAASDALDLARALRAWRLKDWDGSDALADRILADRPNHARALKLRAKTAYGRVSERQMDDALWAQAEEAAIRALAVSPDDPELHLFRVAVSLPDRSGLSEAAVASLDWLGRENTHQRLPHTAMMMIPALIYEHRFDQADRVLDSAARWTREPTDNWVIDRLRGNVDAERAETHETNDETAD